MQIELGDDYGLYASLLSLTIIFSFLLDLGTTAFNLKELAGGSHFLIKSVQVIIPLRILLMVLYFFVMLVAGKLLGYGSQAYSALLLLVLNQVLLSWMLYFRSMLAGLHQYKKDSLLSVLDKLLMVLIGAPFLLILTLKESINIFTLIGIQSTALAVTLFIVMLVVYPSLKGMRWKPDFKVMAPMLKKALPFAMLTFLMGVYTKVDMVMIEQILPNGATETNIYAAAFRLLEALNMAPILISGFLLPMLVRSIGNNAGLNQLVGVALRTIGSIGGMAIAISYFNAEELMQLMYPNSGAELVSIFQILILSFFPFCMMFVFGTLLTAAQEIKYLNQIAFAGAILNFGLNLFIIPHFGSLGAAYTTLFTQSFVVIFHIYKSLKRFKLNFRIKEWIMPLIYFVAIGIVAFLLSDKFPNWYWLIVVELGVVALLFWMSFSNKERLELFRMFNKKADSL